MFQEPQWIEINVFSNETLLAENSRSIFWILGGVFRINLKRLSKYANSWKTSHEDALKDVFQDSQELHPSQKVS